MKQEFVIKRININGKSIKRVVVDSHVRKHIDITDDIILDLVRQLDGTDNIPDDEKNGYQYFVNLLLLENRQYRLIWLLEKDKLYIGVITAYRDRRRK